MAFAKKRDPETKKLVADKSTIDLQLADHAERHPGGRVPLHARLALGDRVDHRPLPGEDRQGRPGSSTTRTTGAAKCRDPRYIIDLLARIVTVSLETMQIVDNLPAVGDPRGPEPIMTMTTPSLLDGMSDYERKVWAKSIERLNSASSSPARKAWNKAADPVAELAGKAWTRVPMHEDFEEQLGKALEGLVGVTLEPAMKSVNVKRVVKRVGVPWDEFQGLDLKVLDRASPRTRGLYSAAALAEGSATAVAVTGATVSATVTGGTTAAVAVGAIATDVATSIALLGRIVAAAAAEYGYDVRDPEEEIFALGAISIGAAGSPAAKVAALASLSRLTQQMMRRATWTQLNRHSLVRVIDTLFKALGFKLTQQKLGQAVPIAGILINGGMSAQMASQTYRRARDVYRLRFLSDKYGIDPSTWVVGNELEPSDDVIGAALDELEHVTDEGTGQLDD